MLIPDYWEFDRQSKLEIVFLRTGVAADQREWFVDKTKLRFRL